MSSSSSSSTSNTFPTGWIGNPSPGTGGGTQSTLYLLTFLITLVVLAVISAALLLRAYYVRRRFQRRIQEAIANGQALPPDALAGLGITRPRRGKPEKKVGPMPTMWEAEMYKDEVDEDGSKRASKMVADRYDAHEKVTGVDEGDWQDLTPLGMVHFPEGEIKPAPTPTPPEVIIPMFPPTMPRRQLLRSLFRRDDSDPLQFMQNLDLNRVKTGQTVVPAHTSYEVPEEGSEVTLGVLIAFPTEAGAASERWSVNSDEDEGQQVPDVCLGVMEATIGPDRPARWG